MTDKTPLGELIEITESEMDKYAGNFLGRNLSEKGQAVYDGTLLAFSLFIKKAKSFLPEEKQAIVDAYKKGCADTYGNDEPNPKDQDDSISADLYFTQKYKA